MNRLSVLCLAFGPGLLAQTKPETPTLRSSTRVVVVDVVVTDSQGNPVHNLQQTDFRISEDGKPQVVAHFHEHTAASASNYAIDYTTPGTILGGELHVSSSR